MSSQPETAWFVDAWSVLDGRLFASLRPPHSIEAERTVFMSVPYLEPIPIGRISTALRATRSGFQEGLRDASGGEIPFDALDDLRELVRRAYLMGGLGPDPIAGPPRGDEPPPDNAGGRYFDMAMARLEGDRHFDVMGLPAPHELSADDTELLSLAVQAFVIACTIELLQSQEMNAGSLFAWSWILHRSGLAALLEQQREYDDAVPRPGSEHDVYRALMFRATKTVGDRFEMPVAQLTSQMYLPRRSIWDPRLSRLSEKLILPLVDPEYWSVNNTIADLAPAVLLAHLNHGRGYHPDAGDRVAFIPGALDWLRRESPQRVLHFDAEEALSDLLHRRLAGGLGFADDPAPPPGSDGDFVSIAGAPSP